jgi:uncharacterized protein YbjT (DUF2867 family)
MTDHVLVVGATGRQGGAVARHLLRAGSSVRALTRNPSSPAGRRLASAGADVVGGDLDDPDSLRAALAGIDAVFSVQDYWAAGYDGEIRQGTHLVTAAAAAGVGHLIQSTMADAPDDPDLPRHFASKREVERIVGASGVPHTLLGTVFFMDNFADRATGGPLLFPTLAGALRADVRVHMLAADDIGAATAAVLADPAAHAGARIDLAGDLLTVPEMKAAYRRATGRRARRWRIPSWMSRRFNPEFADQLRWHNRATFTVDPADSRAFLPDLTRFETFVRAHRLTGL